MLVAELWPYGDDGEQRFSVIGADVYCAVFAALSIRVEQDSHPHSFRQDLFLRLGLVSARTRSHVQCVVILVGRASSA